MVYELEKEHKKSSLMCKKKEELVKEIMRLEHNVNVMNERLDNQANAIRHYEQESRTKAVDEFAERLEELFKYESAWGKTEYHQRLVIDISEIYRIAEEMRGAE